MPIVGSAPVAVIPRRSPTWSGPDARPCNRCDGTGLDYSTCLPRIGISNARRIGISNARPVQGCPPPVARNRPYVASKLRGRVAGLGYLGHQQASAQSLWPVPGHPASEPRRPHGAHAGLRWSLGQAGPYRLAHRSMKSGLILEFTAGWTAQAAPAPQAAARSDTAPAQHAPGARGSSQ